MPAPRSRRRARTLWILLPLTVVGFAAFWLMLALSLERQASWMAVLGAADVLWILSLCGFRQPRVDSALAVAATLLIVVLANWAIAAAHVGRELGILPWESITRLGFDHARTLVGLANGWQDGVWIALAVATAAGWPWLSARRRALSAR